MSQHIDINVAGQIGAGVSCPRFLLAFLACVSCLRWSGNRYVPARGAPLKTKAAGSAGGFVN
jgi:hypothetical protein